MHLQLRAKQYKFSLCQILLHSDASPVSAAAVHGSRHGLGDLPLTFTGPAIMSKKAKKKSMETVADAAEPPELAAEVRALAAQLGLGAAGGLEHAFDDFAPKQAKQKLGKASKRKADALDEAEELDSGSGGADGDAAAAKAAKVAVRKQRAADKAAAAGARGKQADQAASVVPPVSDAMAAAIKERQWNLGAGPRPGERARNWFCFMQLNAVSLTVR